MVCDVEAKKNNVRVSAHTHHYCASCNNCYHSHTTVVSLTQNGQAATGIEVIDISR